MTKEMLLRHVYSPRSSLYPGRNADNCSYAVYPPGGWTAYQCSRRGARYTNVTDQYGQIGFCTQHYKMVRGLIPKDEGDERESH